MGFWSDCSNDTEFHSFYIRFVISIKIFRYILDDFLDSELLRIVVDLVNIPVFMDYIFSQSFVHELNVHLVPAPQYITDCPFEVKGLDIILVRRFCCDKP